MLCYHAISAAWPSLLATSPERLETQLRRLVEQGYRGLTFEQAMSGDPGRRTLAVTFDDACRSVLRYALPIMRDLGIPGTVYTATRFVGSQSPMTWPGIDQWLGTPHERELMCMDWDGLEQLASEGWEVGSHSQSHAKLSQVGSAGELEEELGSSRAVIVDRLGSCATIAYPYGDQDAGVRRAAEAAGYSAAAGLRPGPNNRWCWPRVGIYPADNDGRFRIKASPVFRRLRATHLAGQVDRMRSARKS